MKSQRTVRFIINPERINFGSAELRVMQLVRILEQHLGSDIKITIESLPSRRGLCQERWALKQKSGDIIVFAKISLPELRGRTLDILRFRGVRTCIDYVDSDLRLVAKRRADVHIAASESALRLMQDIMARAANTDRPVKGKAFLVHHNTDARLANLTARLDGGLRTVYFGDIRNTIITDSIAEHMTIINIDRSEQFESSIGALADYNLHYCVRQAVEETAGDIVAKPFTKGFIAAQMGVAVMINDTVDDAALLLGSDYPFMITGTSETAILAGLHHVADAYGGPEWHDALDRMTQMRQFFSHDAIARQFQAIVNYLS
jgi:hypothetical protein